MTTKEYQSHIIPLIREKMPGLLIANEWVAFRGYKLYSPRVDIAVGPFSIQPGYDQIEEYDTLTIRKDVESFLIRLFDYHVKNVENEIFTNEINITDYKSLVNKNKNARCFLAIEIENKNSKKHIMGSLINAASLGRVGIGIAYSDKTFRTFIRILNYLAFLKRVGKNTYDTTNFLVVTVGQMNSLLNE